jgi:hypothetical protein
MSGCAPKVSYHQDCQGIGVTPDAGCPNYYFINRQIYGQSLFPVNLEIRACPGVPQGPEPIFYKTRKYRIIF